MASGVQAYEKERRTYHKEHHCCPSNLNVGGAPSRFSRYTLLHVNPRSSVFVYVYGNFFSLQTFKEANKSRDTVLRMVGGGTTISTSWCSSAKFATRCHHSHGFPHPMSKNRTLSAIFWSVVSWDSEKLQVNSLFFV